MRLIRQNKEPKKPDKQDQREGTSFSARRLISVYIKAKKPRAYFKKYQIKFKKRRDFMKIELSNDVHLHFFKEAIS
ncbi:unnamed protein product [Lupinus luteus]|uniref:Uncharacterized protein n=1 Tax=Lupinus luteus TaxID=3873 RepID=A0AAV1WB24_LUPLU